MVESTLENLLPYLPMDRRLALASGEALPPRADGAAVFVDISGFTVLTEALARSLGPQRAAEELSALLDRVYEVVITRIHRYRGSVISFAGDAITCWFAGDDGRRAASAALSIHGAMEPFRTFESPAGGRASITVKASIAVGAVSRYVVGDPRVRLLDVIAGETLTRLGRAEALARAGETLLDPGAVAALGALADIGEYRTDPVGMDYGVLSGLTVTVDAEPWPVLPSHRWSVEQIRPWVLVPLFARIAHGPREMLAELRGTVALFVRFAGIDFDRDPDAGEKLDAFVRQVQEILEYHAGTLIDINFGDKGSYLYANFGAPIAHQDNTARACDAALALATIPDRLDYLTPLQIGISRGRMRAGAYGASSHRTYGVLGEAVNMAARIMMTAAPGEIRAGASVQRDVPVDFVWGAQVWLQLKGSRDPVPVYCLSGRQRWELAGRVADNHEQTLVGRRLELDRIEALLTQAVAGQGQVIGLLGEAGIGKSRLCREAIRTARAMGFTVLSGKCESYAVKDSYKPWRAIFTSILSIDLDSTAQEAARAVSTWLAALDPRLVRRLPLLGPVLGIEFEETAVTRSLDPKLRKLSLESLLVEMLNASALEHAHLLILEDSHGIDELSLDLLTQVGRGILERPVVVLLLARPTGSDLIDGRLDQLPNFHALQLEALSQAEMRLLAGRWLRGAGLTDVDESERVRLVNQLVMQAEGNPLYLEELVNFVRNRDGAVNVSQFHEGIELPPNMQNLVLSRIDQLPDPQQVTLKVASVLGRSFDAGWLEHVYPEGIAADALGAILTDLCARDMFVREADLTEPGFAFRNGLIHSAVYESLPHGTRSTLHERFGLYLEERFQPPSTSQTRMLAHHFLQSENRSRKRKYLQLAAEDARLQYANEAAIFLYAKLLAEVDDRTRIGILLKLGEVKQLTGQWSDAGKDYAAAVALADRTGAHEQSAWAHVSLAELERLQGRFAAARAEQETAMALFDRLDNEAGVAQVFHIRGTTMAQQGEYEEAVAVYQRSLLIRRRLRDRDGEAKLLSNLAILSEYQGRLDESLALHEAALDIRRDLADLKQLANSLNNVGYMLLVLRRMEPARRRLEEAVDLLRDLGDLWALANSLNNLGNVYRDLHRWDRAGDSYAESLELHRTIVDDWSLAYLLEDIAHMAVLTKRDRSALVLYSVATKMRDTIDSPLPPAKQAAQEELIATAASRLSADGQAAAVQDGNSLPRDETVAFAIRLCR